MCAVEEPTAALPVARHERSQEDTIRGDPDPGDMQNRSCCTAPWAVVRGSSAVPEGREDSSLSSPEDEHEPEEGMIGGQHRLGVGRRRRLQTGSSLDLENPVCQAADNR
eukprot:GHVU01200427.1.p3 GENE.GHVU01200427.1~~GHVU01200427.1.p3  ORF type:complete len:109 (+),score=7.66 GHVU01200427.1:1462-1788(+)